MTAALAMAAAALAAAGCAVPLGPGFKIEKQRLEAAVVRTPEPHMDVRASWRVKNTGDRPLRWLDVEIPDAEAHGLSALRIESGGKEVAPGRATYGPAMRIPFDEPLEVKDRREVTISYTLAGGAGVVAEQAGFVLPPGDWAPVLVAPEGQGSFARGGVPPKKWDMTVRVPADFRVYASGHSHGRDREGQDVVFRFQERRGGVLPFAAGGAYEETRTATAGTDVIFWTRQSLPADSAERAADFTVQTIQFFDGEFGTRPKDAGPLHIIECVTVQPCWPVPGAALPGAELYSARFTDAERRMLDSQLARTWLDFRVQPDWEEEPYPMGALADYAADLAAIARRGPGARMQVINEIVQQLDSAEASAPKWGVLSVRLADTKEVRRFAELRSELFFFALEDAAGADVVRQALLHLERVYPGETWRAKDLRSALELASGKDLAALFRQWLTEKSVPPDFRTRH